MHPLSIFLLVVVLIFLLKLYLNGRYNLASKDLKDKIVVITGGTHGMGERICQHLLDHNATVVCFSRNESLGLRLQNQYEQQYPNAKFEHVTMDLGSLESVKKATEYFIKKYKKIDYLINNAGILVSPYLKTRDNYEKIFGVNYLGHFLFNLKLKDIVKQCNGRIIVTSSIMANFANKPITFDCTKEEYNNFQRYSQSKLALNMMTKELSLQGIEAVYLHPGVVTSNILGNWPEWLNKAYQIIGWFIFKSVEDGIQTTLHCVFSDEVESGAYYKDCMIHSPPRRVNDEKERKEVWDMSMQAVNKYL